MTALKTNLRRLSLRLLLLSYRLIYQTNQLLIPLNNWAVDKYVSLYNRLLEEAKSGAAPLQPQATTSQPTSAYPQE